MKSKKINDQTLQNYLISRKYDVVQPVIENQ